MQKATQRAGLALACMGWCALGVTACGGDAYEAGDYPSYDYYGDGDGDDSGLENEEESGEQYAEWVENDWVDTGTDPLSTFSADVDTASYSLVRRDLNSGHLPDPQAVRVEEFLNYFRYDDEGPASSSPDPFAVHLEAAPSPFGTVGEQERQLLRVGIQARTVAEEERDPVNLVFLIDVSGSMAFSNKLPLVQYTLKQLVNKLAPTDTLGIVIYAGADAVLLDPTPVENKSAILDAIDALTSSGGTAGEAGIRAAYDLAESAKRDDGVNRVVLCTDGDFNVGATGSELTGIIEDFRDRGIFLTIFGYGSGNYNDADMEALTNHGNGNYAYIDSPNEALRVTGEALVSTLQVVAKDVKIQVEFNPATVSRFRLIGYENRILNHEDFANDAIDAGDIGAGHHVTALYEIELTAAAANGLSLPQTTLGSALAEVRLRHKKPEGDDSQEQSHAVDVSQLLPSFDVASRDLRWAAGIAELAEILRHSQHSEGARFDDILDVLGESQGDGTPSRTEALELVEQAASLWPAL